MGVHGKFTEGCAHLLGRLLLMSILAGSWALLFYIFK